MIKVISISLPDNVIAAVDHLAHKHMMTRSAYIKSIILNTIRSEMLKKEDTAGDTDSRNDARSI